jgi:hypothetical protein
MPLPAETHGDVTWMQWVLGGLAAAGIAAVGWLWTALQGVRTEGQDGRKELWSRVNKQGDAAALSAIDAERRFATKDDLERLRDHFDRKIEDQTARLTEVIVNRPAVKISP